jgi:cytochrome b561
MVARTTDIPSAPARPTMQPKVVQGRYSGFNQALHWITVVCMFTLLPLAWVMTNAKPGTPFDEALFNWHKTFGAIVLVVTLIRVIWRLVDGPPPYPPMVAAFDRVLAHIVYWLFFAVLIWMPVTGYLSSIYGAHPPAFFNVIPSPQLVAPDKSLAGLFRSLHLGGQWAVYVLIALHLSAVAFHLIWGRTGVLGRMLPRNAAEPILPPS